MSPFETRQEIRSEQVTLFRTLRASALFQLLQEASIAHTEAIGMGRSRTLDRGLIWVVARQLAQISRMPVYGEKIRVQTWPGETMHVLFPRYYNVLSESGEPLVRASAIWTLVDMQTRKLAFPEEHGIAVPGVSFPNALSLPERIELLPVESAFSVHVPFSYIDLNGHMNNARYLDLAEDHVPSAAEGRMLSEVRVEYLAEARLSEEMTVSCGRAGRQYCFCGNTDRPCFRMRLSYQ